MITVSDKAKEKVARLISDAHLDDTYRLRASVAGGGCSGLSYKLDFDNEVRHMDQEFEDKGVRVVVDMKSFLYLPAPSWTFPTASTARASSSITPTPRASEAAAKASPSDHGLARILADFTDFVDDYKGLPIGQPFLVVRRKRVLPGAVFRMTNGGRDAKGCV